MEKQLSNKSTSANKYSTKNNTVRNGNKRGEITSNLLNVQEKNNPVQAIEGKFPNKLNPIVHPSVENRSRIKPSKLPVLQKSQIYRNEKSNKTLLDTTMSAADRRQKFQQSRQRVPPQYDVNNKTTYGPPLELCKEFSSWYEANYVNKVGAIFLPVINTYYKTVLPPLNNQHFSNIKNNVVTDVGKNASIPKKKCLLGEITHFPTLCNVLPKPIKKVSVSTVPHLPPIFQPPAVPPPSISNSLENEGNRT